MPDRMVEKVARAIANQRNQEERQIGLPPLETTEGTQPMDRRAARAALEACHYKEMVKALKLVRKTCGGPENWNGETRRFLEATDAVLAKVEAAKAPPLK